MISPWTRRRRRPASAISDGRLRSGLVEIERHYEATRPVQDDQAITLRIRREIEWQRRMAHLSVGPVHRIRRTMSIAARLLGLLAVLSLALLAASTMAVVASAASLVAIIVRYIGALVVNPARYESERVRLALVRLIGAIHPAGHEREHVE